MFVLERASIWECTLSAKGDGVFEGVAIPRMVLWVEKMIMETTRWKEGFRW